MEIFKEFRFEAAHYLPNVPVGHKCLNMHGHAYRVVVYLTGEADPQSGWIIDFTDLKEIFAPILESLDHKVLNKVEGLENPTVENLTVWIWKKLFPVLPILSKVTVYETETSGCTYTGT
ncbi:MAG: 6-carboxytetrahydropterin synthase QueD [Chitinophagales bacterium]|jgi:6-pyruvoyltetrahydropterin/6-carboxytetrahydropterin synthase|nr:6-carboxytetrahydropterin synthase QueD [Chitinophagales bacterium]